MFIKDFGKIVPKFKNGLKMDENTEGERKLVKVADSDYDVKKN